MFRGVAILVALALGCTSAATALLHVHAYTDHDHPDHRHGLAAHVHERHEAGHAADSQDRVESCDPSEHRVAIAFVCGTASQPVSIDAELIQPAVHVATVVSRVAVPVDDIRVHGPPAGGPSSPRAPPAISPA